MSAAPDHAPLEEQIGQWRAYVRRRRAITGPDVEELETHLRDQVRALIQAGLAEDEAFLVAVKRMGSLDALSREFAREHSDRLWKQLVIAPDGDAAPPTVTRTEALVVFALAVAAARRHQDSRALRPDARERRAVLCAQREPLRAAIPHGVLRLEARDGSAPRWLACGSVHRRGRRRQHLSVHPRASGCQPHRGTECAAPPDRAVAGRRHRLPARPLARRRRPHGLRALLGRAVHLLRAHSAWRRRAHGVHDDDVRLPSA